VRSKLIVKLELFIKDGILKKPLPVRRIIKPAIKTEASGGECKPETVNTFGKTAKRVVDKIRTLPENIM
jgi:hypothetical protein